MSRNRDKHEESDEPELVPPRRLAKSLGVDVRTLQRAVTEGYLVPTEVTIGGHARFDLEDARLQWRQRAKQKQEERQRGAKKRADDSQS